MPCWAMIAPIRKVTSGHDRYGLPSDLMQVIDQGFQPERTRPSQDAETGRAQRPQHLQKDGHVLRGAERGTADGFQSREDRILDRPAGGLAAVDLPNVLDKALITAGDANEGCGMAGVRRAARRSFRATMRQACRVHAHRPCRSSDFWVFWTLGRDEIDQTFEGGCMNSGPRTAWTKHQRLALGCRTQQGRRTQSCCRSKMLRWDRYPPTAHSTKARASSWM